MCQMVCGILPFKPRFPLESSSLCQTVRQNTGSSDCPGHWPILGQHWLGMVDGKPWVFPKAALVSAKTGD